MVNLAWERQCFGEKCFMIDADEKEKKNWKKGGIIVGIKVIKVDVLRGQYSIGEDEN